ncbi:MAG: cyclic nucleotide-binding/CBS domain-containing protein [Candidatus Nanohaloarchaea archaeon]
MNSDVTVREVMTDGVIAIEKDSTVKEAARMLKEEGIRGLVVVEEGEAIGIVVCRDIVYQLVSAGEDPEDVDIGEVMSTDLIVAEEDELLDDVAMAMIRNNISRVPVVRNDMLVGIVTQSDILRAWPGFAEILEEQEELDAPAEPREETRSGVCEDCENYSEDLKEVNGRMMCEECRESLDVS